MSNKALPYFVSGIVIKGFGRGSKALGIPTANLPESVVNALPKDVDTGVYYGWASLQGQVHKMVTSIGWNPYFKNEKKSMEVHLLHKFQNDFYGEELKAIIVGYIRPERDFSSLEELIAEIKNDIVIAERLLDEPDANNLKNNVQVCHKMFKGPGPRAKNSAEQRRARRNNELKGVENNRRERERERVKIDMIDSCIKLFYFSLQYTCIMYVFYTCKTRKIFRVLSIRN